MSKRKVYPGETIEGMEVIVNIQMMKQHIGRALYNSTEDYHNLKKLGIEELRAEQERLIPVYNEAIRLHGPYKP